MKLVWDMFTFQQLKLIRGHCLPSEAHCTFCGHHLETQQHVLTKCKSPAVTQIKRQLYAAIASTIAEYIQDEQFRTWAMESVPSSPAYGGTKYTN